MATTKVTITLPNRQLAEIRNRVAAHESVSISAFIQNAVDRSLRNTSDFQAMLRDALAETGGPLTPKERAWARKVLQPKKAKTNERRRTIA